MLLVLGAMALVATVDMWLPQPPMGENLVPVQTLEDASIKVAVDLYGRLVPGARPCQVVRKRDQAAAFPLPASPAPRRQSMTPSATSAGCVITRW